MQSPYELLAQAEKFLCQAVASNPRYWALESLAAVADETLKAPSLHSAIGRLLRMTPSIEDWNNWLDANTTVLAGLSDLIWSFAVNIPKTISATNGKVSHYISATADEPPGLGVSSASMLKGVGGIPQLWLYSGEYTGAQPKPVSKKIGHYDWAVQSIARIARATFDLDFADQIEPFIIGHKARLDDIRQWFQQEPRMLGGGADGTAWDIGAGKVLKIFSDRTAYNHAAQAMARLHNNPDLANTEAMIYDLGQIGEIWGYPIYYYVIEKMVPVTSIQGVTEELRHIISQIIHKIYGDREFWRQVKKKDFDKESDTVKEMVKAMTNKYTEEISQKNKVFLKGIENVVNLNRPQVSKESAPVALHKDWLRSLVQEILMKYLTGRTDLHLGNLGVTSFGKFRYFDPSFSNPELSDIRMPGMNPQPAEEVDWNDIDWNG